MYWRLSVSNLLSARIWKLLSSSFLLARQLPVDNWLVGIGKQEIASGDMELRNKAITFDSNRRMAKRLWHRLSPTISHSLKELTSEHQLSVASGDLLILEGKWYVTHTGLLRLACRKRCAGIRVRPASAFCDALAHRWAFEATVYKSKTCQGFSGYGDADPSNVSYLVQGAEMRVAETRAVNRALRKAYGIGICSVEEIGASADQADPAAGSKKLPPQPSNGNGSRTVRDRLCQVIRQHRLDSNLVKSYAMEFCGVKSLREATREQVENFVVHLADWAEKDRNALLCQLNSYPSQKVGAA
jgi:hypothetical protein